MMKERSKRTHLLKIEIEELEEKVLVAKNLGKSAFARRLSLILEKKSKLLDSWISNS